MFNLPNILTIARITSIPIVIVCIALNNNIGNALGASVFAAACLTDYLDGYFAREWKQISNFGRFLDPIADKLLIASSILILTGIERIRGLTVIPALIILCREILVSGLREFLAEINKQALPVTRLAKWKTSLQMLAIGALILDKAAPWGVPSHCIGLYCFWVAAVLTLVTGYDYLRIGLKFMTYKSSKKTTDR